MIIALTKFNKIGGPLTKRIWLDKDGKLVPDGSACVMVHGTARRVTFGSMQEFADLIAGFESHEALAPGTPRADLPDKVEITTKRKLAEMNGVARPDLIARTHANIVYVEGKAALVLLDYDSKGMPAHVAAELKKRGGFWQAVVSVLPELAGAPHVIRNSTSSGLSRTDTGATVPGSDGVHDYTVIANGSDSERFLKTLHARCWLAGLGWMIVGAAGQLLERSIIDRTVGAPERLVFEGAPILVPPLAQDRDSRRPVAMSGDILDSVAVCQPLTLVEAVKFEELKAKEKRRLVDDVHKARSAFIERQATNIVRRTGKPKDEAKRIAERWQEGVLHPDVVLPFDDPELAGRTVGDVLADPEAFAGETLADPLEGVDYGVCKAKIMLRSDGTPWIHSFAHGRIIYELKHDVAAVRKAMQTAPRDNVVKVFTRLAVDADLSLEELAELRQLAKQLSGVNLKAIDAVVKAAQQQQAEQRAKEMRERQQAERRDRRPFLPIPANEAPWLSVIDTLNEVIGGSDALVPPVRDIDGFATEARQFRFPMTHAFSANAANAEASSEVLPPPEQWGLVRMNDMQVAEMIEKHIDFFRQYPDGSRESVHLQMAFVRFYRERHDLALPTVVTIATAPIVLADGSLLAPEGLERKRGIIFMIPQALRALLPERKDCTRRAVRRAMQFLCDDWLCDVTTDAVGKCLIVAAALTLIERSLLDNRPVFFVTAGRRGGGKTTLITMLIKAVTGFLPAASSWSINEEERRKCLLAQFLFGAAYVLWDNISRGAQIACPHIERSCTASFYADRKLGVSELIKTAAAAIQFFTGNNIVPRGDLASRALTIRIDVERPDPENREFKHPNPLKWTDEHRSKILAALYTILLGNPELDQPHDAPAKTRFKLWWRLVGSAVEHAAACAGRGGLDFEKLFVTQEELQDDEAASLADALEAWLSYAGPKPFKAADVAEFINDSYYRDARSATLREYLYAGMPDKMLATPRTVGKRLNNHIDEPVRSGGRLLVLRRCREGDAGGNGPFSYWIEAKAGDENA